MTSSHHGLIVRIAERYATAVAPEPSIGQFRLI